MIPLYLTPTPPEMVCTLVHDTGGWTLLTSHPATLSDGRPGQVFDVPDTTPDGNGCALTIGSKTFRGVLYLHNPTGAGILIDNFPALGGSLPRLVVQGKVLMQDVP